MIVGSWNVNSISVRLSHIISLLVCHRPNVLCLQETKVADDKFPKQPFLDIGYHVQCYGERMYNGVAIISDQPLSEVSFGFQDEMSVASKRLMAGTYNSVKILNVYIPNGAFVGSDKYAYKLSWLGSLKAHLANKYSKDDLLILCGDFNIAPEDRDVYDPQGLADTILVSAAEREALAHIVNWGFIDVFRKHHQETGQYSWWDYRMAAFRRNMGLRIDHIWATYLLAAKCTSAHIDKEQRKLERPSDHAPVIAKFDIS